MTTDISISNAVYTSAERLAQRLGISVSELYEAALTAYISAHTEDEVTEALDRIYGEEPSALDAAMVRVQMHSIGDGPW